MGLYGNVDNDGRVKRSIISLKEDYKINLFSFSKRKDYSIKDVNIEKIKLHYFIKHPPFKIIYFMLIFIIRIIKSKPHIVYLHDYYFAGVGKIIKIFSSALIVYDAHEIIIPMKTEKPNLRKMIFYYLEKKSIKYFNQIICANSKRALIMKNHYKLDKTPIVIHNYPKISKENISDKSTLLFNYSQLEMLDNELTTFVYQGFISPGRELDKIFEIVLQIPNTQLLILGGGDAEHIKILKKHFVQKGYENVYFLGLVPPNHMYGILKYCDFGIISYSMNDYNNIYCAPNKIFEYAKFELPMISTNQDIFVRTFKKFKVGVSANLDDYDQNAIFNSLKTIAKDRGFLRSEFQRFNTENNPKNEMNKLRESIKNINSNTKPGCFNSNISYIRNN